MSAFLPISHMRLQHSSECTTTLSGKVTEFQQIHLSTYRTTFCTMLSCHNCKLESAHDNIAVGVEPPSSEHPTNTATYSIVSDRLRAMNASLLHTTAPFRRLRFWPSTYSANGIEMTEYASHGASVQWGHLTVLPSNWTLISQGHPEVCANRASARSCGRDGIPRQRDPVAHALAPDPNAIHILVWLLCTRARFCQTDTYCMHITYTYSCDRSV